MDINHETFDWVTALVGPLCSINAIFEKLKSQVSRDVETRKAQLIERKSNYTVAFTPNGDRFIVSLAGWDAPHSVITFILAANSIVVNDKNDHPMLTATVTLNDEGKCKLLVDGQEKELWQIRKRALENLLFTGPFQR